MQRGRVRLTRVYGHLPRVRIAVFVFWAREEWVQERLRAELQRTVQLSLRSDVPVGVLLSGGIDSSGLTALAAINSTRRLSPQF